MLERLGEHRLVEWDIISSGRGREGEEEGKEVKALELEDRRLEDRRQCKMLCWNPDQGGWKEIGKGRNGRCQEN